jgi:hypothetical protein
MARGGTVETSRPTGSSVRPSVRRVSALLRGRGDRPRRRLYCDASHLRVVQMVEANECVETKGAIQMAGVRRQDSNLQRRRLPHADLLVWRSPQDREHEMSDPVALDADSRVTEQDVFG